MFNRLRLCHYARDRPYSFDDASTMAGIFPDELSRPWVFCIFGSATLIFFEIFGTSVCGFKFLKTFAWADFCF